MQEAEQISLLGRNDTTRSADYRLWTAGSVRRAGWEGALGIWGSKLYQIIEELTRYWQRES